MAGTCCNLGASPSRLCLYSTRLHTVRCCSNPQNNSGRRTPILVKFAVSAITEVLRLLSSGNNKSRANTNAVVLDEQDVPPIHGIEDVVSILKSDYENAYFVSGVFTSSIYAEDCIFQDPTIKFRGTELYSRNLQLLVPFFEQPSIALQKMEKGVISGRAFVSATWRLRTYLKLPWRPLIRIDGSTVYDLDDEFKIVRHAESWNVSALEAIGQIFWNSK